jgi:hypothetical protein
VRRRSRARLAVDGIVLSAPNAAGRFVAAINETFTRRPAADLAAAFATAARGYVAISVARTVRAT